MAHPARKNSREPYTLGRRAFAKISAVEGISISDAADRDFREFERKHLSSAVRRRAIAKKFAQSR